MKSITTGSSRDVGQEGVLFTPAGECIRRPGPRTGTHH